MAVLDIVLPCLNEAQAIPWVLARIPSGARALVVDNGSSDGSGDVAGSLGADVVRCEEQGYGAACHAGLTAATAEFVAICDCDASIDPCDAWRLLGRVGAGVDLVVGRRVPTGPGAWSTTARLANAELARRVRRKTGVPLRDLGPLRVARRIPLLELGIQDRRSGYPVETLVRAARAGWRIENVDIAYAPRMGRSKVTGTVRGAWLAARDMRTVLSA